MLHPYYKLGLDCACFIKVTEKNKLIFLNDNVTFEDLIKDVSSKLTALDLKNLGNVEFQLQSLHSAINFYSRALLICPKEDIDLRTILLGNRCESKL